jgi:putative nucleotidyltransferase with HDIG domain
VPDDTTGDLVARAEELAGALLAGVGDRWEHTQGVARVAGLASNGLPEADRACLLGAAWLHDIGYAPEFARSGFHALDGATALLERGFSERVAGLVAHHSMARYEADARGLATGLTQFPAEDGPVPDALTWADMTTDPQGRPVRAEDRIAEILERYQTGDSVHAAIRAATTDILAAVQRTEDRIGVLAAHPM